MTAGVRTIRYPVTDLAAAKARFGALLGAEPVADAPSYVGWRVAGQGIGLDPNGHRGGAGPVPYWSVDAILGRVQGRVAAGGEPLHAPKDVGGGKLIARVKDADGNVIGLSQDA